MITTAEYSCECLTYRLGRTASDKTDGVRYLGTLISLLKFHNIVMH